MAHKTTNLACINNTKLKAFPVLLPPLQDQREVVGILDAIDRKIDVHRKKRTTLDELFKALLHKLMTRRSGSPISTCRRWRPEAPEPVCRRRRGVCMPTRSHASDLASGL